MNKPSPLILAEIRGQLKTWAYWRNDILSSGLKFSRKNILIPLIDNKDINIRSTQPHQWPTNEKAEKMDELINLYTRTHDKRAKILKLHYLKQLSLKEKVAESRLPKTTYFRYLNEAEYWLCEQLFTGAPA